MTTAKLVTTPAQGHGLTQKITDQHFAMAVKGEPVPLLAGIVMLKQVGFDEKETAQGKHRSIRYEVLKLEPILDRNQGAELQFMLEALFKARTKPDGEQSKLPITFPGQQDDEKRAATMEAIEGYADDRDIPIADIEQQWRDHFGIGTDPEANLYGIPGDYRKAAFAHLSEFAFAIGALGNNVDEQTEIPPAVFSGSDADALAAADDDPLADDGPTDSPAVPPVEFSDKKPRGRRGGIKAVPDGGDE